MTSRTSALVGALALVFSICACTTQSGGTYACRVDADCDGASGNTLCIDGFCRAPASCGTGLSACGVTCVDLQRDPANCGACGNSCAATAEPTACLAGVCTPSASPAPQAVLDSPALTAGPSATLHLATCAGLGAIFITTNAGAPAATDDAWVPCTVAPLDVPLTTEGANTIYVWGESPEGLVSAAPASLEVVLDTTPPEVSASGIADGQTLGADSAPAVSLTLADGAGIALAALELSLDGENWAQVASVANVASGTYPLALPLPAQPGAVQVRVRAVDALGNQGFTALGTITLVDCDPTGVPFSGGTGAPGHPFRICSVAQLAAAPAANGTEFQLWSDLDLTGAPIQFGYLTAGTFDGRGHTLSHYALARQDNGTTNYDVGLFSAVGDPSDQATSTVATVKDLTLQIDSFELQNTQNVGGIAGHLFPGGLVSGCTVQLGGEFKAVAWMGGLVGVMEGGTLEESAVQLAPGASSGSVVCDPATAASGTGSVGGAVGYLGTFAATQLAQSGSGLSVSGISVSCPSGDNVGGIAGSMNTGATLSSSSASQVNVAGLGNTGGAVGDANGVLSGLSVLNASVSCGTDGSCGGAVGYLSPAQAAGGLLAQDTNVSSTGGTVGGLVGGGDSNNGATMLLQSSQAVRTSAVGTTNVGGAVGSLTSAGLGDVVVSGQPALTCSSGGCGGLVGAAGGSFSLARCGTDARITGAVQPVSGLVGSYYPSDGQSASISQCYSRSQIFGTDIVDGGRAGGFFGDLNNIEGAASVSIDNSYVVAVLPLDGPLGGALIGGFNNPPTLALALDNVFVIAAEQAGHCLIGGASNPQLFTAQPGVFWDSDLCSDTSPLGTGLGGAAFASEATFTAAGYQFTDTTPGAPWTMGVAHPQLAWEPAGATTPPPQATWTPPTTAGAESQYTVDVNVTSPEGIEQALVQISFDGGQTWTTVGMAGPLSPGDNEISFTLPDDDGTAQLRLVLDDGPGDVTVLLAPQALSVLDCDPSGVPFGGGTGTADAPYRICSNDPANDQLDRVSAIPDASYRLYSDLSLNPNEGMLYLRAGTFDGGGHTLSHLNLAVSGTSDQTLYNVGLFGDVGGGAPAGAQPAVENLTLQVDAVSATFASSVGALVGNLEAGASIQNVTVLLDGQLLGTDHVGPIAGTLEIGSSVTGATVNGMVGGAATGTVACEASGNGSSIGGALGASWAVASGISVTGVSVGCTAVNSGGSVAGIAGSVNVNGGQTEQLATLVNSSATNVSVHGSTYSVGGAAGNSSGAMTGITVTGATIVADLGGAGGIVGSAHDTFSGASLIVNNSQVSSPAGGIGGAIGELSAGMVQQLAVSSTSVSSPNGNSVGGLVGQVGPGAELDSSTASQVTVSGAWNVGGAVGQSSGAHSSLQVLSSSITCASNTQNCGGAIGAFSPASPATGLLVQDTSVVSAGDGTGGLVGGGQPSNGSLLLQSSQAVRTSVTGTTDVGGAIGNLGAGLADVTVSGHGTVAGVSNVGGLVGNAGGPLSLLRCGSDANIVGTSSGPPDRVGGLVGQFYPPSGAAVSISGCYSRVTIAATSGASGVGAGGFFGVYDAYASTVDGAAPSSLTIADSYAAAALPQVSPFPPGGLFANLWGHGQLSVTLDDVLVLSLIPGQGQCIAGQAFQPTVTGSGIFWDGDLCNGANDQSGSPGSAIVGAALTDEAGFLAAGYTFADQPGGGQWTMGPAHPQLAWEPASPVAAPPQATWTPPATVGAGSQYTVDVNVTSPSGAAQALAQISLDGGQTWITVGVAGPLSFGDNQLTFAIPEETGDAQLRLVVEDGSGDATALAPIALSILECEPGGAPFGGGLGTLSSPFRICTPAQLASIGPDQQQANGTPRGYALASDIDLSGQTVEIANFFAGTFDGAGHALLGFSATNSRGTAGSPSYNFGLFDQVGGGDGYTPALIENLDLEVDQVSAPNTFNVGALVGSLGSAGAVESCSVGIASGGTISGSGSVGALGGYIGPGSTVLNSSVSFPGASVSCDGTGNFSNGSAPIIGGALGYVDYSSVVSNVSAAFVSVSCPTGAAGGLAGYMDWNAAVSQLSVSNASVSGVVNVGGIAGTIAGPANHLYVSSSTVTSTGDQYQGQNGCGGVAASVNTSLTDVTVADTQVDCPGAANVGGVAGILQNDASLTSVAVSASSSGATTVVGCNATGGIVGSLNQGVITNATIDANSSVQLSTLAAKDEGGCSGMGGIVGWFVGGTVDRSGSAARLEAASGDSWVGGIAGYVQLTNPGTVAALVRESYARSAFSVQGVSSVGGLIGSVFGSNDPAVTLSLEYDYTDQDLSLVAPSTSPGGLIAGNGIPSTGEVLLDQVVAFGNGPTGDCTLSTSANVKASATFYANVCVASGDVGTAIDSSDASSTSFFTGQGFDFDPGQQWQAGTPHPVLAWEPSSP